MRSNRITERDVDALLHGNVPEGDEQLRILANAVDAIRTAYSDRAPRPSAELAARLDLGNESGISASAGGLRVRTESTTSAPALPAAESKRGYTRMFISWIAGLGLAAKIALAATAAAAVGVGAGATGILPVQDAIEQVVGTETTETDDTPPEQPPAEQPPAEQPAGPVDEPAEETDGNDGLEESPVDEPATDEPATHGEVVREAAHDKTDDSRPHGHSVREVASQNGQEHRSDKGESTEDPADTPIDSPEGGAEDETEAEAEGGHEASGKGKNKDRAAKD